MPVFDKIADELIYEIKTRNIQIKPINYKIKYDPNSQKVREIGVQHIKHQLFDFIAVKGAQELWDKRIGFYQCASIPKKGQVQGKKIIENWLRKDSVNCVVAVKGDIKKCYPSINTDNLKNFLKKDIDNNDLLWLIFYLIDTFKQGLSIGSYLSQYLCNYYLSFAFHELDKPVLNKMYTHKIFYMDDFLIIGTDKQETIKAMQNIIEYIDTKLLLTVKPDWQFFYIDYIDKDGKRKGQPIDMMGFVIYRTHTEIRDNIFLNARRTYMRAQPYMKVWPHKKLPQELAFKCIAYYGWIKYTNSNYFMKKYNVKVTFSWAKHCISQYAKENNKKIKTKNGDE